jgi:hypothetical protein
LIQTVRTMDKNYFTGIFSNEDSLVAAFTKLKENGIKPDEVYTPYPIHEILDGMGNKTRISHAAFIYGLLSTVGLIGFMYYVSVIDWPLNFGGKPFNAFPSFIVVNIVATILVITLLTLLTFSLRAKIFPGKEAEIYHPGATDDKFVMLFSSALDKEKEAIIIEIVKEHGEIEK